jgi:hypothetical protein
MTLKDGGIMTVANCSEKYKDLLHHVRVPVQMLEIVRLLNSRSMNYLVAN